MHYRNVICLFAACMIFQGCFTPKSSVTNIHKLQFIVRDSATNHLLEGVAIRVGHLDPLVTNSLGYAQYKLDKQETKYLRDWMGGYIYYESNFPDRVVDSFKFNKYFQLYPLYLSCDQNNQDASRSQPISDSDKFADMHYHASLKSHNHFGNELYPKNNFNNVPDNLFWYKDYKKIRVPYNGKLKYASLGEYRPGTRCFQKMKLMLDSQVYPGSTMNPLIHYTQATNDHRRLGNVYLAYNSISPFEPNVANTGTKRFANKKFVTGASEDWLRRIGYEDSDSVLLTPWRNFNNEFQLIRAQSQSANSFHWKFFDPDSMDFQVPNMINAVEGGHIFQHLLFPVSIYFNPDTLNSAEVESLYNKIQKQIKLIRNGPFCIDPLDDYCNMDKFQELYSMHEICIDAVKTEAEAKSTTEKMTNDQQSSPQIHLVKNIPETDKRKFITDFLSWELENNVKALKAKSQLGGLNDKIRMITISHFTYNGLMGQANPLDGGKFPNNLIARKNYAIRVSDDKTYMKQWAGAFFTIPGDTKYGRMVIDSLKSNYNQHRIYIDLKHSDLISRQYFYDKVMEKDVYPPICSHCAANGLPSYIYSPAVNEYMFVKTKSVNRFYPFQINLYNDEIPIYFKNGGIIGILFEERALGSYINHKIKVYARDVKKGEPEKVTTKKICRLKYLKQQVQINKDHLPIIDAIGQHYDSTLVFRPGISKKKKENRVSRMVYKDYCFIEPFLHNLFYFIDKSSIGMDEVRGIDSAWMQLCIGSDLDGIIDPLNVCPTASNFPRFKSLVKQYIPLYLQLRAKTEFRHPSKNSLESYFKGHQLTDEKRESMDIALDYLFYTSLKDFTIKYMKG